MYSQFRRNAVLIAPLVLMLLASTAFAQYKVTNLVTNKISSNARLHTDKQLINAWGLARSADSPYWISDNGTGLSTLYDGGGVPQSLVVSVPSSTPSKAGTPTGIVFNDSNQFVVGPSLSGPAIFLFATLDGTISGWNPNVNRTHAEIAVDLSKEGAAFTGLAISSPNPPNASGRFLYAADGQNNRVDMFDGNFKLVKVLVDPTVPKGFVPYGIQDLNRKVYITYASSGNAKGGFIDVYSEQGALLKRLVNSPELNQPWGLALAPKNFGPFSGALLVSNNVPAGTVNAFNAKTGKFLGRLTDAYNKPLVVDQIWGLSFGGGTAANGAKNQLFFTAGPANYANGLFGVIGFTGK